MKKNILVIKIFLLKSILTSDLLIGHENIDPYKIEPDLKKFSNFNKLINFPPNMCNNIFRFRDKITTYEIYINKYRETNNGSYLGKIGGKILEQFDNQIEIDGIKARNAFYLIFNLETIKNKDENKYIESEDDKLFKYMEFPEDKEEYQEDETTINFKRDRRLVNWSNFGTKMGQLMYVYNYNEEKDHYYCLRTVEMAQFIFKIIYFNYLPGKNAVVSFLQAFLKEFFTPKQNAYEKQVYFKLFRSFYALHLQWFIKLDPTFIALMYKMFENLENQKIQESLISNFISLYLTVIKTLDLVYLTQKSPNLTNPQIVKEVFKEITIKAGIFAFTFTIGYLKTFIPEQLGIEEVTNPLEKVVEYTGITSPIDFNEFLKVLNNDENNFKTFFKKKINDMDFFISLDDVVKIYEKIKVDEENKGRCDMCEANINFNDYVVYTTNFLI